MKFLGLEIERKKNRKPLSEPMKQPATLLICIADHVKQNHGNWKIQVLFVNPETLKSGPIMSTTVTDFAVVVENVEDYLRERFGAALFRVEIYHPTNELAASYDVAVGGPKAYRGAGAGAIANRGGNGDGSGLKTDAKLEGLVGIITAVKSLFPEDTTVKEMMLKMMDAQLSGGGPSRMDDLMEKMFITVFNNGVNAQENELERMGKLAELSKMFSPNVPEENLIGSLLQFGGPIVAGLLNKGVAPQGVMAAPGMAALPPGSGGVDANGLLNIYAALPPDKQKQIQDIMSSGVPAAGGVQLPRPGAPVDGSDGVGEPVGSAPAPPLVDNTEAHHKAIDVMVDDIRQDLRGAATDNQVAQKMLAMITAARGFTSSRPHPLLKTLMEADATSGPAAFLQFCRAIPELQYKDERIESIGQEIIVIMEQGAEDTIDVLRDEEAEQSPEAQAELVFEYETREDLANSQTEAQNGHAPRSAGVPGSTEEVESGEQQDSATDRTDDPENQDYAQAV